LLLGMCSRKKKMSADSPRNLRTGRGRKDGIPISAALFNGQ
jgi:hypothetical protein